MRFKLIGGKYITTNICRIQANDSIMCEFFCILFIDFMLEGKSSLDYTKFLSLNEYENNDKTILIFPKTNFVINRF